MAAKSRLSYMLRANETTLDVFRHFGSKATALKGLRICLEESLLALNLL
jgi:hypothetical protein